MVQWIISGLLISALTTLASSKPIMVTFGTNQGSITPTQLDPDKPQPRTIVARSPAPVQEVPDDIPNPNIYKPLVPQQYRTRIFAIKPQQPVQNLFTSRNQLQQTTTPSSPTNLQPNVNHFGVSYRGPHIFEKQAYYDNFNNFKTRLLPSVKYEKSLKQNKVVPQIGVVYSAGVKYYVPQVVLFQPRNRVIATVGEEENSVYDRDDQKYYHRSKSQ